MQIYPNKTKFSTSFVNAFDEFNDIQRKLFNIPDIDKFLSFSDRKNLCIANKSQQNIPFLHSIIAKFCIDHNTIVKKSKTIVIDAGNGNNLGTMYLNLIKLSLTYEFDVDKVLDQIIITRAFTFYQLLNIIINEIPLLLYRSDHKIQIIVLDLLDTLLSNSRKIGMSGKNNNWNIKNDFDHNKILLDEIIDCLINLSNRFFVVIEYNDSNKLIDNSIVSKFDNIVEIDLLNNNIVNKNKKIIEAEFVIKTESAHHKSNSTILSPNKVKHLNGRNLTKM